MNFLGQLGIDLNLVAAQAINFAILVFILSKFVYKPIFKRVEEDENKLKEVQTKSNELDNEKKNLELLKAKEISDIKQKSENLISEAEEIAKDIKEKTVKKAQEEADEIISQAKLNIQFNYSKKQSGNKDLAQIFSDPKVYKELESVFFLKLIDNLKTDLVKFKNIESITLESAHKVPDQNLSEFSTFVKRYIGEGTKIEFKENPDLIAGYRVLTNSEAIDQNLLFEITNEE